MNYRLSTATLRVKGKHGYVLEHAGKTVAVRVSKTKSSNIKEDILMVITEGLREARSYVKHEDILYIEVQNIHLQQWLSGMVEYKEYSKYLDDVFEVLESMDCRYKFVFEKEPYAKQVVSKTSLSIDQGSSLSDIISEFEGSN